MKRILKVYVSIATVLVISVFVQGCDSQSKQIEEGEGVTLSGKINYPQNGLIILEKINGREVESYDTITLKPDNTFRHFVALESPGYFRLNIYGIQVLTIILNKSDLEIIADGNNASGFADIKGSTEIQQLRNLKQFIQVNYVSKENQLNQEFVKAKQSKNESLASEAQEAYLDLQAQKEKAVKEQIEKMGASLAVLQAINYIDKDKNFEFVARISEKLTAVYPMEPNIINLAAEVELLRKMSIGQPAPEIALPGPDGEIVKLSSLKGKYVMVEFWAEWCKPCRIENPNVVRAYNQYRDKGFEIFGVSLDKTKEKWLKAINDDGLIWIHVSDLKGWKSEGARIYNVSSIPASFLLDQKGVIIAKNLRGDALHQKLAKIFGE